MELGLKDKVALIAASSAGLGKATALGFAREGVNVVITGRDEQRLQETRKTIIAETGVEVMAVRMNVT